MTTRRRYNKCTPEIEQLIIDEYKVGSTLKEIGDKFSFDRKWISKILKRSGIEVKRRNNNYGRVYSNETRAKFSKLHSGNSYRKGKYNTPKDTLNYIQAKHKIEDSLQEFCDVEKVKIISKWMTKGNIPNRTSEIKYAFLKHFYYNEIFNRIYHLWINRDKNKWYRPTLDHIIPKSRGGSNDLSNLQILTWFENRAKAEMTDDEWLKFITETNTSSKLFIR